MAHRKQSASDHLYIYYVTDGNGRQLAVGDSVGHDYANPDETDPTGAGGNAHEYLGNGGKYAGGMHDSFGFQAERHPATEAPDLSFFRNRWFDQKTGRWTQEDPLGLAAGTNLYNYVGNNPTAYTDPFGLQECDPPDDPKCQKGTIRKLTLSASAIVGVGVSVDVGTASNLTNKNSVRFANVNLRFGLEIGASAQVEWGNSGALHDVSATAFGNRRAISLTGGVGVGLKASFIDQGLASLGGTISGSGGTIGTKVGVAAHLPFIGVHDAASPEPSGEKCTGFQNLICK